jgi:hypothetical protein
LNVAHAVRAHFRRIDVVLVLQIVSLAVFDERSWAAEQADFSHVIGTHHFT